MKQEHKAIGRLYTQLIKAKETQIDIVSNHGESINIQTRSEIVDVWNALDIALIAVHNAMKIEGIDYSKL